MNPEFYNESNFIGETDQEIAERVATKRAENIKQVVTLHGPKSDTKKFLQLYDTEFTESEMEARPGTIIIDGLMNHSYCLYGLDKNVVIFKRKIKHVMVRGCDNTKIYLNGGTIAGIDVLFGTNVSVRTSKHNFTNVEESSNIQLNGTVDHDSLIHVTKSLDVFVNKKNLIVNPYNNRPLKLVYNSEEHNTEHNTESGKERLSISPTADSCNERWQSKLMLMGRTLDNHSSSSSDESSEEQRDRKRTRDN